MNKFLKNYSYDKVYQILGDDGFIYILSPRMMDEHVINHKAYCLSDMSIRRYYCNVLYPIYDKIENLRAVDNWISLLGSW